jgi:ribosomal protein S6
MSKESKESLEKIQKIYETVKEGSDKLIKESEKLGDKGLTKKIQKVQEGAGEVVKHIEERKK